MLNIPGVKLRLLTQRNDSLTPTALALVVCLVVVFAVSLGAADLEPRTVAAFERYVNLTQTQIDSELASHEPFLWVERLPAEKRAEVEAQLHDGKAVIERLQTVDSGKTIPCPGGMIHHWIATVFVPGATLAETLALVQDYNHHQEIFRPDVVRSRILGHDGGNYLVNLRFMKKKVVTSVIDTDQEIHYDIVDATRAWSWSRTTRVQQVDNAGKADERLLPDGLGAGFLWKMNTYWRFKEKGGGTYVECQSVSLTRDIPTGLGWLIGPVVTSVPRESLTFTLATIRSKVLQWHRTANAR